MTTTFAAVEIPHFVHVGQACAVSSIEMLPNFVLNLCPECKGEMRRATSEEAARIDAVR